METILLYLALLSAGFSLGALLNFVVDRLYVYRGFFDAEEESSIREAGWLKYEVWPALGKGVGKKYRVRAYLVLLLMSVITPALIVYTPAGVDLWWAFLVVIYFGVVIVMDLEFRIVMHQISITGAVLGLIVGISLRGISTTFTGGAIGYLAMWILYQLGILFLRFMNRRREVKITEVALGYGDVNIAGVVGLFIGWPGIILGLLFAIFTGGIFGLMLIAAGVVLRRYQPFSAMPYAPFLALAAMVMLFFPEQLAILLGG